MTNTADLVNHAGDISFLIDAALGVNDSETSFSARVDQDKIALGGFSFGAAATYLTVYDPAFLDSRIKAAIIMAGRLGQGMPGVGVGYELNAIAAAIIGGTSLAGGVGTVLGTIIGAALMALIDNLLILLRVESWWNELIIGLVIVLAVTVDMITAQRRLSA